MQKYLILMFAALFLTNISAQEELDSSATRDVEQLKDLNWVVDTTFRIFKTSRFPNLRTVYPGFKTFKKFIDTSAAGEQSEITKYTMYNRWWNGLRIQHAKMSRKVYKAGIDWTKTTLDSFYIDSGGGNGMAEFAYVHWVIKYNNKRKYLIRALYLKMDDKWFIMDELKFVGLIVEKKKKKKKKK
jgi:hypothetical protein